MPLKYFTTTNGPRRVSFGGSETVRFSGEHGNGTGNEARVMIVSKRGEDVVFIENCEQVFSAWFTRAEAVEMLRELIAWIESDAPGSGCAE